MTARFSYLTDICKAVDAVYWQHFAQDFLAWRGVESLPCITHPRDWFFLGAVACVRWPRVVAQAISHLDGAEPRDMTPAQWHAYFLRLLECADGHRWEDMWEKIAPGRGVAWPGLCSWAERLELLEKPPDGAQLLDEERRILRLGRRGIRYQLLPQAQSRAALVSRDPEPLLRFALVAGQLAEAFMPGGANAVRRQYLTRWLLSLVEHQYGPEVWDPLSMAQLQQWAPDVNSHCSVLGSWACERARLEFGMSPLHISSAACFWRTMEREAGSLLLSAKPSAVLNSVRELHRSEPAPSHDGSSVQLSWWPSMRELSLAMAAEAEQAAAEQAAA